jgi:hypothetical protein
VHPIHSWTTEIVDEQLKFSFIYCKVCFSVMGTFNH